MAFEGMDPVVIRDISSKMDTQAKALQSVLTVVQAQIDRARTAWQGPAATHFEAGWNGTYRPALVGAHDQLSTMSLLLGSEARAQDVTSQELSGPGGGSGALPTGGSGGPGAGGTGPDGSGGSDGDSHEDGIEPLKPIDKLLWALGAPFLGGTTVALSRLGYVGATGLRDILSARSEFARGAQYLANEVTNGRMLQSTAAKSLGALTDTLTQTGDDVTERLGKAYKFLGDGGLPELAGTAGRVLGAVGVAGGVFGLAADGRTLFDPKASGWQKGAAIANAAGTAVTLPAAVAAATGTELTGALAAGSLVPGVGEVVLLGSAAYLAYTQIGWVHDGVNAAAKGVWNGAKWLGNEELKGYEDLGKGALDVGKGAVHVAGDVAGDVGHGLSSAGSSVKHFLHL